jgi:hypothetical protein
MFMFMDSLKPEAQQNQYNNLNEKLYLDISDLNNKENISDRIVLLFSILEGAFLKTEKAKGEFYVKAINLKIISYLPRIESQEAIDKTFSLLNATLPVFNNG